MRIVPISEKHPDRVAELRGVVDHEEHFRGEVDVLAAEGAVLHGAAEQPDGGAAVTLRPGEFFAELPHARLEDADLYGFACDLDVARVVGGHAPTLFAIASRA